MTSGRRTPDGRLTRREALGLLSASAGLGLAAACRGGASAAQSMRFTSADSPSFPSGAVIRTLRGDVDPEQLANGATLIHEHLGGDPDAILFEVDSAGADGVTCLVDSTGRRRTQQALDDLQAVADRSDVHIVRAGGYLQDVGFTVYPVRVAEMSEDALYEQLVQDAADRRWGAFGEIGSSLEMRPDERKVHRAVGRAHVATGLPIFTHTPHESCPSCAMDQMDTLESVGVDFSHLVIGHMSTIKQEHDPIGTHSAIARRGAFIGLDTVGHEMSAASIPAAHKVRYVLEVLDAGYEDNLLLAADFSQSRQLKANWGHGFSTVLLQFVPKLRYAGVDEATLHKVLVDNPRRFLSFVPPAA